MSFMHLLSPMERDKINKIEDLAIYYISKYLPPEQEWKFKWNRSMKFLGRCNHTRKIIFLSYRWALACELEETIDTILHEIAHALTPYDSCPTGHGPEWKKVAIKLGAKPESYFKSSLTKRDLCPPKYELVDTTTGRVIKTYFRKPNARTFAQLENMYVKGRKKETLGKLRFYRVNL